MENNANNQLLNNIFEKICLQNDFLFHALSTIESIDDDSVKKDAIVEVINAQQATTKFIAELLIKQIHN
jgi:hypothetical protein